MKVSHWTRLFCVLALFVCAGCPSTKGYVIGPKPPHGHHYVLMEDARLRKLNLEPVSDEDAEDEDRTGYVITGGAAFGSSMGGMVSVTLTTIKVDATGESGTTMTSIQVYAGSGNLPGSPTAGTLVTTESSPNPTKATISTFANPAPNYDTSDEAYWIWVVVHADKAGVPTTINGQLELTLVADTYGAGLYEY